MNQPPKSIKAFREERVLEIGWHDGTIERVPFRSLRAACPCAGCVDELTGIRTLDVDAIPDDIAPAKIELCGNYALKIVWNDGHATGLYTWQHLARLSGGSQATGGSPSSGDSAAP
jgi:DUF971 family protein